MQIPAESGPPSTDEAACEVLIYHTRAVVQARRVRVDIPIHAPDGTAVDVAVHAAATLLATPQPPKLMSETTKLPNVGTWATVLFGIALGVYLATRVIGLTEFPIYFFCDEAMHAVLAESLLENGMQNRQGGTVAWLPGYFRNVYFWNLGLSVYLHSITVGLFGKTVFVTRLLPVIITLLGSASVAGILWLGFRNRLWWAAPLVLGVTPAWFLHSRTAFETMISASFFAGFIFLYLLYRLRSGRWGPIAVLAGAGCFYSYANGQMLMAALAILLLVTDVKYHWRQRWTVKLAVFASVLICLVPYVNFITKHPDAPKEHLNRLQSYVVDTKISTQEKVGVFAEQYALAWSPAYWLDDEPQALDGVRHRIRGFGHLSWFQIPFIIVGLAACLWRFRSSVPHRVIILAAIAVPISPALAEIHIPRVIAMLIPFTVFAVMGLELVIGGVPWLLHRVRHKHLRPAKMTDLREHVVTKFAVICLLVSANVGMLGYCLSGGPTWYNVYGLYGMQWGVPEVYGWLEDHLREHPQDNVIVSSDWTNYPDVFVEFFLPPSLRERVQIENPDQIATHNVEMGRALLILAPEAITRLQESGLVELEPPIHIVYSPDGKPFIHAMYGQYVDNVEAVIAARAERDGQLFSSELTLAGQTVTVLHSRTECPITTLTDNNPAEVFISDWINPLQLQFLPPEPLRFQALVIHMWTSRGTLSYEADLVDETVSGTIPWSEPGADPVVKFNLFSEPRDVAALRLTIEIPGDQREKVHIRDLRFE